MGIVARRPRANPPRRARRLGFAAACLLAAAGCADSEPVPAPANVVPGATAERPNVVLLIVDTLRADKLGAYGFPLDTSPELDALAAAGVRFDWVLAPSSWTRPSVGTLVTGRRPRSLGLYRERNQILPPAAETLAEILARDGWATFGMTANPNLNRVFHFHEGFEEYVDSHVVFQWMQPGDDDEDHAKHPVHSARAIFDAALDFADRNRGRPVYLQLDIMETHEYARPVHTLTRREFHGLFPDREDALYLQAVRQASADIGAFVAELTRRPGGEHTLFAITSDHGEGLGDHPNVARSRNHGRVLYESNLRVPLILYRPGWQPARPLVTRRVRLLDLLPTLLDLLGLPVPGDVEGVSLRPLFEEPDGDVAIPDTLVAETDYVQTGKTALYGPRWKLIRATTRHRGVDPIELQAYDVTENGALTNRSSQHPAVVRAMRQQLARWEAEHPRAAPTPIRGTLSEEEREQLESIGYLE